MAENKNVKRRGITLNSPQDARRIVRRIIDKAFEEKTELKTPDGYLSFWAIG
jgi:hypothetical protein